MKKGKTVVIDIMFILANLTVGVLFVTGKLEQFKQYECKQSYQFTVEVPNIESTATEDFSKRVELGVAGRLFTFVMMGAPFFLIYFCMRGEDQDENSLDNKKEEKHGFF